MTSSVQTVFTSNAPSPGGHYSQAIAHGGQLFISGQLPVLPDGAHDNAADFEAQARRAMANLIAIADAAGSGASQLIKVNAYIVGIENWPIFNRVFAEMMGDHRPARAIIPVPELHYDYRVEVDAIAAIG
ncbi:MAG: RidA family protein [Sphingorhabdus sp.]